MEAKYRGNIKGMDPLATGPADITLPSFLEIPVASDFPERRMIVSPDSRVRKEEFGGLVAVNNSGPLLLNEDAFAIILELKEYTFPFSPKEVIGHFGLLQESTGFFWALFTRGVFQERV